MSAWGHTWGLTRGWGGMHGAHAGWAGQGRGKEGAGVQTKRAWRRMQRVCEGREAMHVHG